MNTINLLRQYYFSDVFITKSIYNENALVLNNFCEITTPTILQLKLNV